MKPNGIHAFNNNVSDLRELKYLEINTDKQKQNACAE